MREPLTLPRNEHYLGCCKEVLRSMPDNSVDLCLTDTPYNLTSIAKRFGKDGSAPSKGNDAYSRHSGGFMGQQWDATGIAFDPEVWVEVGRVLKPGAHLFAFGGSRTHHRLTCAIEDATLSDETLFEIRDCLMWVYCTGFAKSRDIGKDMDRLAGAERAVTGEVRTRDLSRHNGEIKGDMLVGVSRGSTTINRYDLPASENALQWDGWGTAVEPTYEPIVVARKLLSETSIARNVLKWGTGALNIAACRIPRANGKRPGWHKSGANGSNGYLGSDTFRIRAMSAEEIQSRCGDTQFPTNMLLSHGPDCDEDGCQEGCPAGNLGDKASYFQQFAYEDPLLYFPKPTQKERDYGCDGLPVVVQNRTNPGGMEDDPKWAPKEVRNNHPTLKSIALGRYLCRLGCPPGGTVLDIFQGSGSFGCSALLEGFHYLGIEKEEPYWNIAKHRTAHALHEYEQRLLAALNEPQLILF